MDILAESFTALRRNALIVLLYALAIAAINAAAVALNTALDAYITDTAHATAAHLYTTIRDLLLTAFNSLAQAVVFAQLGADIDRPLWRVSGHREAIRRYFQLWFIINLFIVALGYVHLTLSKEPAGEAVGSFLLLLWIAFIVICVPVGACVMFRGPLTWAEGSRSLSPLLHELPRTLLLFFLSAGAIVIALYEQDIVSRVQQKWFLVLISPLFDIPAAFLECFVFAGAWLICMTHREQGEDTDLDF